MTTLFIDQRRMAVAVGMPHNEVTPMNAKPVFYRALQHARQSLQRAFARMRVGLAVFVYLMLGMSPAMADDIDVYTKAVAAGGGGASVIMFHIDTSASMNYDYFQKESNAKMDCAGGCDASALPTSLLDKRFFILSDAMRGQITSLSGNFKVGIVGGDGAAGGVVMAQALPLSSGLTGAGGPAPIVGGVQEYVIQSGVDDVEQPSASRPVIEDDTWSFEVGPTSGSGGLNFTSAINGRWTSSGGSSMPATGPQDWPGYPDWGSISWYWSSNPLGNIKFFYQHRSASSEQTFYLSSPAADTVLYVLRWDGATGTYVNYPLGPQPSPGDDTGVATKICEDDAKDWSLTADGSQCVAYCKVPAQETYPLCAGKKKNDPIYKPFVLTPADTNSYVSLTGLTNGMPLYGIAATKTAGQAGDFQLSLQYPERGQFYGDTGPSLGASIEQRTGLRFKGVNIPRDAAINNAYVQFQGYNNSSLQIPTQIRAGMDESIAPASFTDVDLFDAGRSYRWGMYQLINSWYDVVTSYPRGANQRVDVTGIFQQHVQMPDWCGGDVVVAMEGDGSLYDWNKRRIAFPKELATYMGPAYKPATLVVDWSPGAAVPGVCEQIPEKDYRISTSTEDVTQLASGSILLDETYLSFSSNQKAGLRFTLVDIPPGAQIESAKLVLTAHATGTPSAIRVRAIDEPLSKPFGAAVRELDDREVKTAVVSYTPTSWEAGNTYTIEGPQFTALVQGMVSGPGWEFDGALGFILSTSGSELRTRSWEYNTGNPLVLDDFGRAAPRLLIKLKAGTVMPGGTSHRRQLVNLLQPIVTRANTVGGYTSMAGSYALLGKYVKGRTAMPAPAMQTGSCANNVAILVTDVFENANTYGAAFSADCGAITGSACGSTGGGKEAWPALFSMLAAMYEPDKVGAAGQSADGNYYSMRTYSIGMGPLAQTGGGQLKASSNKGGGKFFAAKNAAELVAYFKEIIRTVADTGATIAAPGVAVNALNKFEHLDELYYSLFKPSIQADWEGNLKRYRLKDSQIVDVNNTLAVDNVESLFAETARSWWSPDVDGATVTVGGAGSKLATPDTRKVYTWIGEYGPNINASLAVTAPDPAEGSQPVIPMNMALTPEMLGVPDTIEDSTIAWARKDQAVSYLRGGSDAVARRVYGAAIHGSPTLVTYGVVSGQSENTVFLSDNNGVLHMVDTGGPSSDTAATNIANTGGGELFAFIPQELLVNGDKLAFQKPTVFGGDYVYGLDGTWVPWKYDPAGDGVNAADGDFVYLYGGMRRGGKNVFALDVTSVRKSSASVAPKLLWAIEGGKAGTVYEHMGQSWSTPLSRWVRWNGERRRVIFFGGGYDDVVHDDTQAFTAAPHKGRQVYMVDAVTGNLLWWASSDAAADTEVPDMKYSITAQLVTLDRNGNGVVDGLYAVDLAGQVFRFDFEESAANAAEFVRNNTAATVAKLGATATGASTTLDNRRFYDAPGVAFVRSTAGGDLMLGLVSGYREKPLDNATQEVALMVRDIGAWNIRPPARAALTLADLANATALAELSAAQMDGPGWYINLQRFRADGSPVAEKGIGSPVFFNFALLYTTFVPYGNPQASTCTPDVGYSRLYVLNALTSAGVVNAALDNVSDNQRYLDEAMPGIGSTIQLLYSGGELTLIAGTLAMGTSDGADTDGDGVPDQLGLDSANMLTREVFGDIRRTRWFQMNE